MEHLRLDTLAAQVVAWHNRHPLACRITAAQVHSVGYVVLPGLVRQAVVAAAAPAAVSAVVPLEVEGSASAHDTEAAPHAASVDASLAAEFSAAELPSEDAPTDPAAADPLGAPAPSAETAQASAEIPAAPPADASDAVPAEVPADPSEQAAAEAFADPSDDAFADPSESEPAAASAAAVADDGVLQPAPDLDADAAAGAAPVPDADQPTSPSDADLEAEAEAGAATAHAALADAAALPADADPHASNASAAGDAARSLRERLAARSAVQPEPDLAAPALVAPVAVAAANVVAGLGARAEGLRLAFSESFFDHASARQVAQWALQHARVLTDALPAGAHVRRVPRDSKLMPAQAGERAVDVLLRTATIEMHGKRLRLLVGEGTAPAVLGPHLWSTPRLAMAAVPAAALPLGLALALGLHLGASQPAPKTAAARAAAQHPAPSDHSAPSDHAAHTAHAAAASAPDAGASSPEPPPFTAEQAASAVNAPPVPTGASAPTLVAAKTAVMAATWEYPDDVDPEPGRVQLPAIGPLHNDGFMEPTRLRRQALRAARLAAAQAASGASAPEGAAQADPSGQHASKVHAPALAAAPVPKLAGAADLPRGSAPAPAAALAPAPVAAPAPAAGPEYALATRLLRTEAESELLSAAMGKLLQDGAAGGLQVHRVPVGDDWRVVGGPFRSPAAAAQMRALLLARGVKTEVMDVSAPAAAARGSPPSLSAQGLPPQQAALARR